MLTALILGVCLAAPAATTGDLRTESTEISVAPTTISVPIKEPSPEFEVVKIASDNRLELEGSWYAPRRGKTALGVLLVHDAGSDRTSFNALAERLKKLGLAVLTVDLIGHGGSKTERVDWTKLDENGKKAAWVSALKDVKAASKWLMSQDGVYARRLCMVGHGAGCALTAKSVLDDDSVVAVVLLEPPAEAYGFDVKQDIVDLQGIPTRVVAPKKGAVGEEAQAMVNQARSVYSRDPKIELMTASPPVLEDKAAFSDIGKFLRDYTPKKG